MKRAFLCFSVLMIVCLAFAQDGRSRQSEATFTYLGQLEREGAPYTGPADIQFSLWERPVGGARVAPVITRTAIDVRNGVFRAPVDFPSSAFNAEARWLEVSVRAPAGGGKWVTLSPRRRVTTEGPADIDGLTGDGYRTLGPRGDRIISSTDNIFLNIDSNNDQPDRVLVIAANRAGDSGGTELLRVDEKQGHIGIGTSAPQYPLDVHTDGSRTVNALNLRDDEGTAIYGEAHGDALKQSNGVKGVWRAELDLPFVDVPAGVRGDADGFGVGVLGVTRGAYGVGGYTETGWAGVYGLANSPEGLSADGVVGESTFGFGVDGSHSGGTGTKAGVRGWTSSISPLAVGVHGIVLSTTPGGSSAAVRGENRGTGGLGIGVWGSQDGSGWGVYGATPLGRGVYGRHLGSSGAEAGVHGDTLSTSTDAAGVWGVVLSNAPGSFSAGVRGQNNGTGGNGIGVFGSHEGGGWGVYGFSFDGRGVYGLAFSTTGGNVGVYGQSNSTSGFDFFAGGAGINYGSGSSIRWKKNIGSIDDPLYKVSQLRGVYFDWDAEHGGHHDVGMIAEEVGKVLPEIVQYEENGIDAIGMDYSKLTPLLVEAVNALREQKDSEIASLRAENDDLRARLAALEAAVAQLAAESR